MNLIAEAWLGSWGSAGQGQRVEAGAAWGQPESLEAGGPFQGLGRFRLRMGHLAPACCLTPVLLREGFAPGNREGPCT